MTAVFDRLRWVLILLGSVLLCIGSVLLIYIGTMVYQVIHTPEQMPIVRYVMDHVKVDDLAAYGSMYDIRTQQNVKFEINLTETIRTLLFIFLGVGIMSALAVTLGALIRAGARIVELAVNAGTKLPARRAPISTGAQSSSKSR